MTFEPSVGDKTFADGVTNARVHAAVSGLVSVISGAGPDFVAPECSQSISRKRGELALPFASEYTAAF